MRRLDLFNALLFLWATLGTGGVDVVLILFGGYPASITATVRSWYTFAPWLRWIIGAGFAWLAWHFAVEDLL